MKIPSWVCRACNVPTVPWRTLGLLVAVLLAAAYTWNHNHKMLLDARRDAEAAQLKLKDQVVAAQVDAKALEANVKDLISQNDLLRQAYEEAMRAAPDAEPDSAAELETGPVPVNADPRPVAGVPDPVGDALHPPALPPCSGRYVPDGLGGFFCEDTGKPTPPKCVLASGDHGSFKVDEIILKTKAGNSLVTGTAEFWRETPLPRSKLAAGKFISNLSSTSELADPTEPRWGAELLGACARDGCGLGAGVLLPPVRFMGLRWEARAGAVLSGPAAGAQGALGARW